MNAAAQTNRRQQQQTAQPFNTDQILDNIKAKLFTNDASQSATKSATSATHTPTNGTQSQANQPKFGSSNNNSNDSLYEDFEDFNMNDDFGNNSKQSATKSASTPEIDAAYRAYQGSNKYNNAIVSDSTKQAPKFESFDDFSDEEEDSDGYYEDESDSENDSVNSQSFDTNSYRGTNVRPFQNRAQSSYQNTNTALNRVNNQTLSRGNTNNYREAQSMNSVISHILHREIATYVSSWAGANNPTVMQYLQEACDHIAHEWCNANMPSLMERAVDQWCNNNLESLCANVIREELNKEHKTA